MNDNIEIYMESVFKLIKSLTLKSEDTALAMNIPISIKYGPDGVDENDLETWKYYLNLSGQYHYTDEMMTVTSLDTGVEIDFTVDNLNIHQTTKAYYTPSSKYYIALVNKYESQETLIKGIVNPIDINAAIDATNHSILGYDISLVEPQEETLIKDLEKWIMNYQSRWYVRGFTLTDDLYLAAQLGQLFMNMVPKLLNLRLARCFTSEAHTFHIKNFLNGHYGIGAYIEHLNMKEVMWLYKNIRYLERYVGSNNIITALTDKLLTPNSISISKLGIRQLDNAKPGVLPGYQFTRESMNERHNDTTVSNYTLERVLELETRNSNTGGVYGDDFISYGADDVDAVISLTKYSELETKIIDTSLTNYGDISTVKLSRIVIDNWITLANNDTYNSTSLFTDPNTGDVLLLSQKHAVILFIYLLSKKIGVIDPIIPNWHTDYIPITNVDFQEIVSGVPADIGLDTILARTYENLFVTSQIDSVDEFVQYSKDLYLYQWNQWVYVANTHDAHNQAYLRSMFSKLYTSGDVVIPNSGIKYSQWLQDNNYSFIIDDSYNIDLSITELVLSCTGYSFTGKSDMELLVESAMAIFNKMIAYTTQNISEVSAIPIAIVNQTALRMTTNVLGVLEKPDLRLQCMVDYDVVLNMVCSPYFVPTLTMECTFEDLAPTISMDCSLYNYVPVLSMDCSIYNIIPNITMDCSLYELVPTLSMNCETYNYVPVINMDCSLYELVPVLTANII